MSTVSENIRQRSRSGDTSVELTNDPVISEEVRIRIRQKCREALGRLFPEGASNAIGDWNPQDIRELTAIFELARTHSLSVTDEREEPILSRQTILLVINKLATGRLFDAQFSPTLLPEKEQHLRLLATALRLYKYEELCLSSDVHDQLYAGLNKLDSAFKADRENCPTERKIEQWNVAFYLQHCQYLLTSIKNDQSLASKIAKRVMLLIEATGSAYQYQVRDVRENIMEIARRQRSRAKWHDEFLRMEDIHFALIAKCFKLDADSVNTIPIADTNISEELATVYLLRDSLEEQLQKAGGKKRYKLFKMFGNVVGRSEQLVFNMGTYEENSTYLSYGLLDLMYQLSFQINQREQCFREFVAAIKHVLEWSDESDNSIHRKAIDLYRRIDELGKEHNKTYGDPRDRAFIDSWLSQPGRKIELPEYSKKFPESRILV